MLSAVISFSASAAKSELFNYFGKNRGTIEASKELVKPQNGVFRKVSGKEEIAMDFERVNIKGGSAYEDVAGYSPYRESWSVRVRFQVPHR